MVIQAHLSKMRAVFSEIRENSPSNAEGDEAITFAMLEEKINSPTVQQLLETLGFLDQNFKSSKCKAHGTVHGGVLNVWPLAIKVIISWWMNEHLAKGGENMCEDKFLIAILYYIIGIHTLQWPVFESSTLMNHSSHTSSGRHNVSHTVD